MGINDKTEIKFLMLKKRDAQQFIKSIKSKFKTVQIINKKWFEILEEKGFPVPEHFLGYKGFNPDYL